MVSQLDTLTAPTGLVASLYNGGTGEEVRLVWANRSPVGLEIQKNDGGGFTTVTSPVAGTISYNSGLTRSVARSWRVRHVFGAKVSPWSNVAADPTGLNAPTGVTATYRTTAPVGTLARVAWTNAGGIYTVEIRRNGGTPVTLAAGTALYDDATAFGSTIYWEVRHTYGGFTSAWTTPTYVTTIPAPTGVVASLYTTTKVRLDWALAVVSGATFNQYTVRLEKDEGSGWVFAANTAAGAITYSSGLDQLSTRSWRVRSEFAGVVSPWSAVVVDPGIAPPTAFTTVAYSGTLSQLNWASAAAVFATQAEKNDGAGWVAVTTIAAGTSTYNSGLTASASRSWRIRHSYNGFLSAWSAVVADPTIAAPTGFTDNFGTPSVSNYEKPKLDWTPNALYDSRIQRYDGTSWGDVATVAAGTGTYQSAFDRAFVARWRVRFSNGSGLYSGFSSQVQDQSAMLPPTGLTTSLTAGGKVQTNWTNRNPSGSAVYETRIERDELANGTWVLEATVGAGVASYDSGRDLVPGRLWRVRHEFNGFLSTYTATATDPAIPGAAGLGVGYGSPSVPNYENPRLSWTVNNTFSTAIEKWNGAVFIFEASVAPGVSVYQTSNPRRSTDLWRIRHFAGASYGAYSASVPDQSALTTPTITSALPSALGGVVVTFGGTPSPNGSLMYDQSLRRGGSVISTQPASATSVRFASMYPDATQQWGNRHTFNGFSGSAESVVQEAVTFPAPTPFTITLYTTAGVDRVLVTCTPFSPDVETEVYRSGVLYATLVNSATVSGWQSGSPQGYNWKVRHKYTNPSTGTSYYGSFSAEIADIA